MILNLKLIWSEEQNCQKSNMATLMVVIVGSHLKQDVQFLYLLAYFLIFHMLPLKV